MLDYFSVRDVAQKWGLSERRIQKLEMGKVRSIGISNFEDYNFDKLIANAKILPVIHQTECHPYRPQNCRTRRLKMGKTWLITGCSEGGIGAAIARCALESGNNVAVTARNTAKVANIIKDFPDTAFPISHS